MEDRYAVFYTVGPIGMIPQYTRYFPDETSTESYIKSTLQKVMGSFDRMPEITIPGRTSINGVTVYALTLEEYARITSKRG